MIRLSLTSAVAAIAMLSACLPPGQQAPASGAALYDQHCAACHGPTGKGDGPAQAGLSRKAPDLTRLAMRDNGRFPLVAVMAKVYGTADGHSLSGGPMPAFGALLEGPTVLVETEPGIFTPTPEALVALAEHVAGLGRN